MWISICRAKYLWKDINPVHENKHLANVVFFNLLFFYSKMYSSHYNLGNTGFVLLPLKQALWVYYLSCLENMAIFLCVCDVTVWFWWFISFVAHMWNSTACFTVNNQRTACFIGRWLYWNSLGSIYQTQGRFDSPQIIWILGSIHFLRW